MKKIIAVMFVLLLIQKWGAINDFFNPPPDYAAAHAGKVIIYGTAWCGYCGKARNLLKDNNIAFYEYDIEKSLEGYNQFKRLGGSGVPMLLINGEIVKGYNAPKILELAMRE